MHNLLMDRDRRIGRDRRRGASVAEAAELRMAIAAGEIEVLFQPQFAANGAILGAEALARWNHPEREPMGGDDLFASAWRTDEGRTLWRHVAQAALSEAVQWPGHLRLSLNVTAADLSAGLFAESVARKLGTAGLPPERLTLEITEQSLVDDLDASARELQLLADLGIAIALDDFGAGFCNFHYMKRLPLHYLKLDRSMVEGIDEDRRDLEILRGIVAMARALGLSVVAEGIERESQRVVAIQEGCAAWQGFLGATPMRGDAFRRYVSSHLRDD